MLDHLIDFEPEVFEYTSKNVQDPAKVSSVGVLDAKIQTKDWMQALGAVDSDALVSEIDTKSAREAFANIVSASPEEITHTALAHVKTPAAVQHLVGMLTAYDWEFVHQAKELRGYAVAKLVEETQSPNANIRLKALGLLGKVTEVGLFTDKIEVKKEEMSDTELDQRIKEKLNRFMHVVDVVDISDKGTEAPPEPTPEGLQPSQDEP
jgi:HEAT repeat protein